MFQGLNSNIQVFNLMNFREELQDQLMNLDVGKVLAPEKGQANQEKKASSVDGTCFFFCQTKSVCNF